MKKKILLLGGSAQQIIAIETAKKLGYETILCDFLPDNPLLFTYSFFSKIRVSYKVEKNLKIRFEIACARKKVAGSVKACVSICRSTCFSITLKSIKLFTFKKLML
mgnify:CR=1 FL=1